MSTGESKNPLALVSSPALIAPFKFLSSPKALPFFPAYAYLSHVPKDFPVAYFNQSRILSLPIYPEMEKETVKHVAKTISHFWSSEASKVIELTAANLLAVEYQTRVLSDN